MAIDGEALSTRLAHQALSLDDMSGELVRLSEAYADLMRRHKALVSRLEEVEETGSPAAPVDEKPPHY